MSRIALLVCILTVTVAGIARATTNVEIQPTGARHPLLGGLAVRARYESRTWDLDLQSISPANAALSASLDGLDLEAKTSSLGAELLFDVSSRVELRGILAATDIEIEGGAGTNRLHLDTDLGLLYGFGVRVGLPTVWLPGWNLQIDVEYLRGSFDDVELLFTGGGPLATAAGTELNWQQFAVSPTISKDLKFLTPYAGLRFATADADVKTTVGGTLEELGLESEDLLSVIVGARFSLGSFIQGDIHVDLLNNQGVVVSVVIRF